jgi:hypothetical protein
MKDDQSENSGYGASAPPESASGAKRDGGGTKERMKEGALEATASMKQMASEATTKAKEMGRDAAHQLQEQSQEFAQSRRNELGTRIKSGGEALRRAAEKLREDDDPNIARYAEMAAERIERVGEYVQERDFGAICRDVENAARKRPELFFGGLLVAGLAISRFLKASNQSARQSRMGDRRIYREQDWEQSQANWGSSEPEWHGSAPSEPPIGSMGDVPSEPNKTQPAPVGAMI